MQKSILNITVTLFLFICANSLFAQNTKKKSSKKKITIAQKLPADTKLFYIDATRAKCEGVTTKQCLLVKKQGQKEYELFYDNIEGFTYEEGNAYTIWVREELKTPPIAADESIYKYVYVKTISKKGITKSTTIPVKNKSSKPLSGMNYSKQTTLIVNEEKTQCEGNPDAKCLLIKKEDAKSFEVFYQPIDGFVFEDGYRQTILVNERHVANPMIKQTEPIYTLIKVIQKEKIKDAVDPIKPELSAKTPLDKKWILRKMKDSDTSSFAIEDNGVWIEFNSAESRFTGKASCNSFFGGFKSDLISSFQSSEPGATRMYCNNMELETLFFKLLTTATSFEIKDQKLSLLKNGKAILEFE